MRLRSIARLLPLLIAWVFLGGTKVHAQVIQPLVAVHDSEFTRALETLPAVPPTPTGDDCTGFQWWPQDWHYFVMPETVKEMLRSDGTAYTVLGDSNVISGTLLTNGQPKYPIVISLASEAIRDDEIAPFTNYVAAGGFLFVGSSAFCRDTNGFTRGDFAFANQMGLHLVTPSVDDWSLNYTITKLADHRLDAHLPSGQLDWLMPTFADQIPWGTSPDHPYTFPHHLWCVTNTGAATVLVQGDTFPFLAYKQYGKGYFIYCAQFQPLMGATGFAPSMYAYLIFRRAIEWAFETLNVPIPKVSPWPYQYDSAYMVRHDLENYTNEMANVDSSAQVEFNNGAKGDYYLCTGTIRDDAPASSTNAIVLGLRHAVTNYGATIGPHNGGLKNPNNPSLARGDYDYWHWGTDEALDVTPTNYASGKAYATASVSNAFHDIEGWLAGTTNAGGLRTWVQCYFNGDREDSLDLQDQLHVNIAGDQKLSPFPHWTVSTRTSGKRYSFLSEPASDWFVNGLVAQSLEPWHPPGVQNTNTMRAGVDFYYNLGALVNFYSHTLSTGFGPAGGLTPDYVSYCANTNVHPRIWPANAVSVYQWWLQRSNVQVSATWNTNGYQTTLVLAISGAVNSNQAVDLYIPATTTLCGIQVVTNGALADPSLYRIVNGQTLRLKVGTSVTNAVVSYYSMSPLAPVFAENFDSVTAPALPSGWTTSASGAGSNWTTQTATNSSSPNAAYSIDAPAVGMNELVSPTIATPTGANILSFMQYYDLEWDGTVGFDGGVLEIKIGTNAFTDILAAGGSFSSGGYVAPLAAGNPLAGRSAWTGNSGGFIQTLVTLPPSASGTNIQLKWRCTSDTNNAATGWRVDSVSISNRACLCCISPNNPPVFAGTPADATIPELSPYSVTNSATDPDGNNLFYSLVNPPAGMSISSSGVIAWMPSEAQGPGIYSITTVVTDNGYPSFSATNSFTLTVAEVNSAPVFVQTPSNRNINELTLMTVTNNATDSDIPANTLTYSLIEPPAGAVISSNGVITWNPSEAQGPGTYTITTVVNDGSVSVTNSFVVTVAEVNTKPAFGATPPDQLVLPSVPLTVTNSATDSDIPVNTLHYSLLTPPAGMTIDTNTGVISWTPTPAQDHTTNSIRTKVVDDGSPPLSAMNTFTIIVYSDPVIVVSSNALAQEGCISTNNAIDPGETVTVLFSLQNLGLGPTTNVVATLLPTNGVVLPSGPQSYGSLVPGEGAAVQPFTFQNTGTCGGTITPVFQLQDGPRNLGQASTVLTLGAQNVYSESFDGPNAPRLPAGWTTIGGGALGPWITTNTLSDTAPNAAFSADANNIGTNELDSPPITLPNGPATLSFRHFYFFEADSSPGNQTNAFDGGVLEIKIGTNAFVDITNVGGAFLSNGYTRKIDVMFGNPLSNHWAWSGTNSSYITTLVSLPPAASGQTIQLRWRVGTDNGNGSRGWRIDTVSVTSYACCINGPPVLPAQTDVTIPELSLLTVTNTATDSSTGPDGLTYQLLNPPSGASIDSNGVITWTPSEAQGPGVYTLTTVVTDNGYPPLSATNSFQATVSEVNSAPLLTLPPDQTIDELTTLNVFASATDTDAPPNSVFFSLLSAPLGMTIDTNTGAISWTPTEEQGPSTNTVTVVATDDGGPPMSVTNSFTVYVREVNTPPALPTQTNFTINANATLIVTNTGWDFDIPSNHLSYALLAPPDGAGIDPNGVITWSAPPVTGFTTNLFVTVVADDGVPPLSFTNQFFVTVMPVAGAPTILSVTYSNGAATVTWTSVSGYNYQLQYKEWLTDTNWTALTPNISATNTTTSMTDSVGPAIQRFYRVSLVP